MSGSNSGDNEDEPGPATDNEKETESQDGEDRNTVAKRFSMLPHVDKKIDEIVKEGPFSNRSEVVRTGIFRLHNEHCNEDDAWTDVLVERVARIDNNLLKLMESIEDLERDMVSTGQHQVPSDEAESSGDTDSMDPQIKDDIYKLVIEYGSISRQDLLEDLDYGATKIHDAASELVDEDYIAASDGDGERVYHLPEKE